MKTRVTIECLDDDGNVTDKVSTNSVMGDKPATEAGEAIQRAVHAIAAIAFDSSLGDILAEIISCSEISPFSAIAAAYRDWNVKKDFRDSCSVSVWSDCVNPSHPARTPYIIVERD